VVKAIINMDITPEQTKWLKVHVYYGFNHFVCSGVMSMFIMVLTTLSVLTNISYIGTLFKGRFIQDSRSFRDRISADSLYLCCNLLLKGTFKRCVSFIIGSYYAQLISHSHISDLILILHVF
jgi:hypothetical protein